MCLPIFKLPFLAQIEVLKQLAIQEVFMLSLCSKKSKIIVQPLNLKPDIIKYSLNGVVIDVHVEYNTIVHSVVNMKCAPFGRPCDTDERPMKLGGKEIKLKWTKDPSENAPTTHIFQYLQTDEKLLIESLHCHMQGLFRYEPCVQLEVGSESSLSNLDNFKNVSSTCLKMRELNTLFLDDFVTAHPDQHSLKIMTYLNGLPLRKDSRLFSIKGVAINVTVDRSRQSSSETDLMLPEIIKNFNGEYLLLLNVYYGVRDWADLMRSWIRKESYANLKFISTSTSNGAAILFEHWVEEFNFLEWDGQRRPRYFMMDPGLTICQPVFGATIDCSDWLDIQQDGGVRWASIKMTLTEIQLVVWD